MLLCDARSLALCSLTQHLLSRAPPSSSRQKEEEEEGSEDPLPARLLHTTLHDWRLRSASQLTSSWLVAPPSPSSSSLPLFLPAASLPSPSSDPLPLALHLLHAATASSSSSSSSARRRLGLCWFSLGRCLLEQCQRPPAALGPLLQACQLLTAEAEEAAASSKTEDGQEAAYLEACRTLQLDARLLTLSSCLRACGGEEAGRWARRAVARAALLSATAVSAPQPQRAAHVRKLVTAR